MIKKGPKGSFLLGCAPQYAKDGLGFLTQTAQKYPNLAFFKFAHWNVNLLSNPEYIKHVLLTNNKNYFKGRKYEELKHFLGNGLLTSEGDFWRKQRKLAQPAFSRERIASFMDTMMVFTDQMLEEWEYKLNKRIDISSEMMVLTLAIVGQTLLSKNLKNDAKRLGSAVSFLIEHGNKRIQTAYNLPMWFPLPDHLRFKKEKAYLDKVMNGIIADKRKSKTEGVGDLLDMLMETKDLDTNESMTDEQLRDEVATIFVAGHETTAQALSWTIYLLSKNPEIEQKLTQHIQEITQGESLKKEHVMKLTYVLQIIEESMRLFPPAWIFARRALEDDIIDGYPIKKEDNVFISPYVMHRSEKFWDNPTKFDPERFSSENKKNIDKFVYMPFGGGPRLCIGNNFALMEMQIVLAHT